VERSASHSSAVWPERQLGEASGFNTGERKSWKRPRSEKIVEAYAHYIMGWFTIPNIKCRGQYEIDLLAVDVFKKGCVHRYHIESGISISGAYSLLTNKPFSVQDLKTRVKKAGQRRTLEYFTTRKFGAIEVVDKLREYGFEPGNYTKVIVSWGWCDDVPAAAKNAGVELWCFQDILQKIADRCRSDRTYFTDDTMRTLQLMAKVTSKGSLD